MAKTNSVMVSFAIQAVTVNQAAVELSETLLKITASLLLTVSALPLDLHMGHKETSIV